MKVLQIVQVANGYFVQPEPQTRHAETISADTKVFETFENLIDCLNKEFHPLVEVTD
jgi:hypothetical protein